METDSLFIRKNIIIHNDAKIVWEFLTNPALMCQWMSEEPLAVHTNWKPGSTIEFTGTIHDHNFVNTGKILRFEAYKHLSYTHWSSLSGDDPDETDYAVLEFTLTPVPEGTELKFTCQRFVTETIFKHLRMYWVVTLDALKKTIERRQ